MSLSRGSFFIAFWLFFTVSVNAQDGIIRGIVKDRITNTALEYSSVSVLKVPDSTVVAGGVSKASGSFELKGIKSGKYILKVQFVGYKTEVVSNVVLSDGEKLNVGDISLTPVQSLLEEIR